MWSYKSLLRGIADIERIVARIGLKTARPRDLSQLRFSLQQLPELQKLLKTDNTTPLQRLSQLISTFPDLQQLLEQAIIENPPVVIRDGGVIADHYDQQLDDLRALSQNASQYLTDLEQREKQKTNLSSLKVGYNRIHGYYIEISRAQADHAPVEYSRRQTLKNVERFYYA